MTNITHCITNNGRVERSRRALQGAAKSKAVGIATVVLVVALLSGCASDEASSAQEATWGANGVCGKVFFWAATDDGTRAVTVTAADGWDPSGELTASFTLPDSDAKVELVEGTDLDRYFCTDLPATGAKAASTVTLAAGSGEMRLDAVTAPCLENRGRLSLRDLATQTGEALPAVEIDALGVGCTAG
jgi:hypothetical protein